MAGIAPGVKLIAADVFGWYQLETSPGVYKNVFGALTSEIIEGVEYATANGADVINMSLGGYYYDMAYEAAINDAVDAGTVVVASAGNDGLDEYDETQDVSTKSYPADFDSCISVIWTNEDDARNPNSNYGPSKDIAAPGNAIISTYWQDDDPNWEYASLSGTSMAAPVVTGVITLMLSVNPDLTVGEVKNIIYSTADDFGEPGRDDEYGYDRIHAHAAVQAAIVTQDGIVFDTATGTITDYTGVASVLIIPSTINGVSVTAIGDSAFGDCDSLKYVSIPSSVENIGMAAFFGLKNLTCVSISSGVSIIGSQAFSACNELTGINVSDTNTAYKSIDGVLFTKDGQTLIQYPVYKRRQDTRGISMRINWGLHHTARHRNNWKGCIWWLCKLNASICHPALGALKQMHFLIVLA